MNNTDLEKNISIIINELSDSKGYICSIDVLIKLDYLTVGGHCDETQTGTSR